MRRAANGYLRLMSRRRKSDLVIKAELPGMTQGYWYLSKQWFPHDQKGKESRERGKDENYHLIERSYGSFTRSVRLPREVQSDKITASFKNGVLRVTLPKSEEAKKKEIKIKLSKISEVFGYGKEGRPKGALFILKQDLKNYLIARVLSISKRRIFPFQTWQTYGILLGFKKWAAGLFGLQVSPSIWIAETGRSWFRSGSEQSDRGFCWDRNPSRPCHSISRSEGQDVAYRYPDRWVIAADTIVYIDGSILASQRIEKRRREC